MTTKKTRDIRQLLESLEGRWDANRAPPPGRVARIETLIGRRLPQELVEVYAQANGGSIDPVDVFTLDDLLDVDKQMRARWPAVVFFASDGADGFFGIDTNGKLAGRRGAVVWVDRADDRRDNVVRSGSDLADFLRRVATGERPWEGPSLGQTSKEELLAALDRRADRWRGRPGLSLGDAFDVAERVGARLPEPVKALLRRSNGMEIRGGAIELYGGDAIAPVEGVRMGEFPAALWIGEDDQGRKYAATILGWRAPDEGWVVRVSPGDDVVTSPLLGPLYSVVADWLEGIEPQAVDATETKR